MTNINSFILKLYRKIGMRHNSVPAGQAEVQLKKGYIDVNIYVPGKLPRDTYDVYFLFGDENPSYSMIEPVRTNKSGSIDNIVKFYPKSPAESINIFNRISGIVLVAQSDKNGINGISGFRNKIIDWQNYIPASNRTPVTEASKPVEPNSSYFNEYCPVPALDKIINLRQPYNPFTNINCKSGSVKLERNELQMIPVDFTDMQMQIFHKVFDIGKQVLLMRFLYDNAILYALAVPDTYTENKRNNMHSLGFRKFVALDFDKKPVNGDFGYWLMFI